MGGPDWLHAWRPGGRARDQAPGRAQQWPPRDDWCHLVLCGFVDRRIRAGPPGGLVSSLHSPAAIASSLRAASRVVLAQPLRCVVYMRAAGGCERFLVVATPK